MDASVPGPAQDGDLEVIVRHIRPETSEIRSFVLEPGAGGTLPGFEAGAHIDVFPIRGLSRQYSLVSDPADCRRYVLGVKREQNGRGGSSAMHGALQEGSTLRISRPRNNFALRPNTGRNILLAGGIGVTPLLCMSQVLAARGANFELHYFARSNAELAFRGLINGSDWSDRVSYHFGLVPPLLHDVVEEVLRKPGADDVIYLCGPTPFMEAVKTCAERLGWDAGGIVSEHFSAEVPKLTPDADGFVIRLARKGVDLVVPADKTIIEVLRDAGIEVKTSCEQGVCGTCVTPVLEGEPEHHDLYLSEDEHRAGLMTLCVSRARSRMLVLDI